MNLLQLIRKAGCVQLHVAPETGNQQLRFETVFKRITNAEVVAAIEAMAQVGISAKLLNMVGLPGETPEITLETLEFIKTLGEHGAAYGMISVFTYVYADHEQASLYGDAARDSNRCPSNA